jgi:hypothetical protein
MPEEVLALAGREAAEDGANPVPEGGDGTFRRSAQVSFQLCEGLLDRIEVRRVWRQIEKLRPCGFDDLAYLFVLVYSSGEGRLPKSLHFADSDVTIGVDEGEKCPQRRLWTSLRLGGVVTGRGRMR